MSWKLGPQCGGVRDGGVCMRGDNWEAIRPRGVALGGTNAADWLGRSPVWGLETTRTLTWPCDQRCLWSLCHMQSGRPHQRPNRGDCRTLDLEPSNDDIFPYTPPWVFYHSLIKIIIHPTLPRGIPPRELEDLHPWGFP